MSGRLALAVTDAGDLSAHGVGGQENLPIPLNLAVAGAAAALVISFTVLAVAWRSPRYDAATSGRPVWKPLATVVESPVFSAVLRVFGMVLFLFTAMVSVLGNDDLQNPIFGIVYVWLWVGIVPLSLLFGPFYKAISPARTINLLFAKLSGSDPDEGLYRYPARLGYWPAALGLLAFVWLELVYPYSTELSPVRLWFAIYVAVMLVGGALWGNAFYENADPFEVYSSLVGKLSVWSVRDGVLIVRSPLANLDSVEIRPGLVAVVGVMLGSTGFDSFSGSPFWVRTLQGTQVSGYFLDHVALAAFVLLASGLFALSCALTGTEAAGEVDLGKDGDEKTQASGVRRWVAQRAHLPGAYAHSIVPIIVGYVVAHYLTLLLEVGSRTLFYQVTDPLGTGADYLGTNDLAEWAWLSYHPTLLATIKVLAVVLGHVVAAVAAHDRALRLLPRKHQLTGQLPLLVVMVVFTTGGLFLLFSA